MMSSERANKYRVSPAAERTVDGICFDSKAEMRRWGELVLLQRAGQIKGLERQPVFVLVMPFTAAGRKYRGIRYVGDFRYIEAGRVVVEDVKGVATAAYKIKRQLFARQFPGIVFREIAATHR